MAEPIQCPECGASALEHSVGGLEIDVCADCGGAWFGRYQLQKVLDQGAAALDELMGFEPVESPTPRSASSFLCPHCAIPLHQGPLQRAPTIAILACYGCAGVYVRADDLTKLDALSHQDGASVTPLFSAPLRAAIDRLDDQTERATTVMRRAQSMYANLQIQWALSNSIGGPPRL